jgi:hypothetical protein
LHDAICCDQLEALQEIGIDFTSEDNHEAAGKDRLIVTGGAAESPPPSATLPGVHPVEGPVILL